MDILADALLICATLSAAIYCHVLSRRLRRLTNLEDGLGAAIASMSSQVAGLESTLLQLKSNSTDINAALDDRIAQGKALMAELDEARTSLDIDQTPLHREDISPQNWATEGDVGETRSLPPLAATQSVQQTNQPAKEYPIRSARALLAKTNQKRTLANKLQHRLRIASGAL